MRVLLSLTTLAAILCGQSAFADLRVTEVMSTSNAVPASTLDGRDWWELTNTGPAAVNLLGYKWEDDSGSGAAPSADVSIFPSVSIAVGESIIIHQGAGIAADFRTAWGLPASVQVLDENAFLGSPNTFSGLGSGGDQINLFTPANVKVDNATFAASTAGVSFEWSNTNVGLGLSVAGENGAFQITYPAPNPNSLKATGSPGGSTNVPEPASVVMMLLAVLGATVIRRR